jgi:predicted phosphoribosyltransferase
MVAFLDRWDAGRKLAAQLASYANRPDVLVLALKDRTVILIDDGLATGSSMLAAAEALRELGPKRIVVAVPVASPATCEEFRRVVDETICALTPEPFYAVGAWYDDFSQTTDDEVRELLDQAAKRWTQRHEPESVNQG